MRRWVVLAAVAVVGGLVPLSDDAGAESVIYRTRRLADSEDVVAAAIDVSKGTWGDAEASVVVLGRDDVFADTLAGASLAGTDGPVLFTATERLDARVEAEIDRVLTDDGCVFLLGGTDALSHATEDSLTAAGQCTERIAGTTRIGTALAVARRSTVTDEVLVARADAWYDAVAAGAYAARTGHPLVLTNSTTLHPAVDDYLAEVDPDRIVLLGGTAALNDDVETAAKAHATTTRIAGPTRDTTAIAIAERWPSHPGGITLVNGHAATGWAYAIAASVNAAIQQAPVLFTQANGTSAATKAHIAELEPGFTTTAGPTRLIRPGVAHGHSPFADLHRIDPPSTQTPDRYRKPVFDEVTTTTDITYGTATDRSGQTVTLKLDIYEPAGDTVERRPLIVWIHGGGFSSGNKESPEIVDQATVFAKRGYVNASISYRLEPGGCSAGGATVECIEAIEEAHEDARTAIKYLRDHAQEHGIDTDRIAIAGTSAGAITALNVGYTSSEAEDPDHVVHAAVSLSGAGLMGPISPGDAPALDFHGDPDPLVPYEWAVGTIRQATEQGLFAKLTTYPGDGHVPYRHRDEIIAQTSRFLWWQLALDGAEL